MARPSNPHPTDAEMEILRILWDSGPAPLGEICTGLRKRRPVATTTVATTLGVMLAKGYVRKRKSPGGYLWSAAIQQRTTARKAVRKLLDHLYNGSAGQLVVSLLDDAKLSEGEVEQIRRLLDQQRGREGGKP